MSGMDRLVFSELETDHFKLRLPIESDMDDQFEFLMNKEHFPYADYQIATVMADVRVHFDKMMLNHEKTSLFWMIALKESNRPIGSISAWNVDFKRNSIEFGYSLYPAYRGQGYMQEVLAKVMNYCNESLHFTTFVIWTHRDNLASIRLAERMGFDFKGFIDENAHYSDETITYATFEKQV